MCNERKGKQRMQTWPRGLSVVWSASGHEILEVVARAKAIPDLCHAILVFVTHRYNIMCDPPM